MGQRLGERLVADQVIQGAQLEQALGLQRQLGGRLGTSLIEIGALPEARLLDALGSHHGTRTASRGQMENIQASVIRLLPAKLAKRYQLVPYELQGKTLLIASADVVDAIIEDEIRMLTGHMVRTAVALELRVKLALQRYYRVPCGVRFGSLAKRLESGTLTVTQPSRSQTTPRPPRPSVATESATARPPRFARQAPPPAVPKMPATVDAPAESASAPPRFARKTPPPPIPPLPKPIAEPPARPRPVSERPLRTLEPVSAHIPLPEIDEHGRPKLPTIQSKSAEKPRFIELDDDDAELLRSMRETADPDSEELPDEDAGEAPSAPARQPFWERARQDADDPSADGVAGAGSAAGTADTEPAATIPAGSPAAPGHDDGEVAVAVSDTTAQVSAEQASEPAPTAVESAPAAAVDDAYDFEDFEDFDGAEELEPRLDDPELDLEERLDMASAQLQDVDIRDEIADVLLGFTAPYLARRLLLFRRQDRILGWRGEGPGVSDLAIRAVEIDRHEPSVFLSLSEPTSFWMASLPPLEPNQRLIAGLGGAAPRDCIVLPVVVRSKIVCYFYGDNRQDSVASAPLAEIRRLMGKAGIAFEVYILKNKMRLL